MNRNKKGEICFESTARICVGFGDAELLRNGVVVWLACGNDDWTDCMDGQTAETLAKEHPLDNWQIWLNAPLESSRFERNVDGEWILIETGKGFV